MLAAKRRQAPVEVEKPKTVNPTPATAASQYRVEVKSVTSPTSLIIDHSHLKNDLTKVAILSTIAISVELGLHYIMSTNPSFLSSLPFLAGLKF